MHTNFYLPNSERWTGLIFSRFILLKGKQTFSYLLKVSEWAVWFWSEDQVVWPPKPNSLCTHTVPQKHDAGPSLVMLFYSFLLKDSHSKCSNCWLIFKKPFTKEWVRGQYGFYEGGVNLQSQTLVLPSKLVEKTKYKKGLGGRKNYWGPPPNYIVSILLKQIQFNEPVFIVLYVSMNLH